MEHTNIEVDFEETNLRMIETARAFGITAEEFVKALNEILEVLKRYGNEQIS